MGKDKILKVHKKLLQQRCCIFAGMYLPKLLLLHWQVLLFILLCVAAFIQLFYFLYFFSRLAFYKTKPKTNTQTHADAPHRMVAAISVEYWIAMLVLGLALVLLRVMQ